MTSKNQITIQHWMTSTRIIRITSGFVYFAIVYGTMSAICNALLELDIFPTYTTCLMDSEMENLDNSFVLAFFVMPSMLMAYTTPIFDFVTFRLMKFWTYRSQQIPKGIKNDIAHCLKITQNVALEFLNFGIFHQFFVLLKLTCLVTLFDRKVQVFKNR